MTGGTSESGTNRAIWINTVWCFRFNRPTCQCRGAASFEGCTTPWRPEGQAKLVTCAYGEVLDVIVDVRVGSPTFGAVETVHLAANEERSVVVPIGAAHGFCATSEVAALTYLLSSPFNAELELEINPFDESLRVAWPVTGEPIVSAKDARAPTLADRLRESQLPLYPAST